MKGIIFTVAFISKMSTPTAAILITISRYTTIYIGSFLFLLGIIGQPLILIVFLSLRTFRQSSCAFYLTIMSIVDISQLFTGLLTLIMINGFDIDWPSMSVVYCCLRPFLVQLGIMISFGCLCLAILDQYFATCSNRRWHRLNNIKLARYVIIITIIICMTYSLPFGLYFNISVSSLTGKSTCIITNTIYQRYTFYFNLPIINGILPISIICLFGGLAYRNIRQITYRTVPLVRRELDKQLTVMVLVKGLCDILAIALQIVYSIGSLIINTPNATYVSIGWNLLKNLANILFYIHFTVSYTKSF